MGSRNLLVGLVASALRHGADVSLRSIFEALEISEQFDTLTKLEQVQLFCDEHDLELVPPMQKGSLDTRRSLRFRQAGLSFESLTIDLDRGESHDLEFKSSLLYDHVRAKNDPLVVPGDLKSEQVLVSSLKTVAAFLNGDGGTLYIGVSDDRCVLGIEHDFMFLKPDKRNVDCWELMLRDFVSRRFLSGDNVNDYLRVSFVSHEAKTVAKLSITPRSALSFVDLTMRGGFALFRRQGNRTVQVGIHEVEEFLRIRDLGSAAGILQRRAATQG